MFYGAILYIVLLNSPTAPYIPAKETHTASIVFNRNLTGNSYCYHGPSFIALEYNLLSIIPLKWYTLRIYLSLLHDTAHSTIALTLEHRLDLELTKHTHLSWPHRWVMGWLLWVLWGNLWYTYQECTVQYVYGLVQERRNSIANALELHLSCTKPSIYCLITAAYPQFALHPQLIHNPGCEALGLWATQAPETTQNNGAKNR